MAAAALPVLGAGAAHAAAPAAPHAAAAAELPGAAPRRGRPLVIRGIVLHFLGDHGAEPDPATWDLFEDGALAVGADGRVAWAGYARDLPDRLSAGAERVDHRGKPILPGFVDTHLHAARSTSSPPTASSCWSG